jgi:hypothetical protein
MSDDVKYEIEGEEPVREHRSPTTDDRSRIGMVTAGNPTVLDSAANSKSGRIKSGPAYHSSIRAGTKVQHRPGIKDYNT